MSIETWKEQYFKIDTSSWKAATLSSIVKWEGLSPENLAAHGLHYNLARIEQEDGKGLWINGNSCSLCILSQNKQAMRESNSDDDYDVEGYCRYCPLAKYLGKSCDDDDEDGPYFQFVDDGDHRPMLEALRGTLQDLNATSGTLADFEDLAGE